MANRPKTLYRMTTDRGRENGLRLTPTDITRLTTLGRWYTLNANQLARHELEQTNWNPNNQNNDYDTRVYAIKRRLARLVRVQENAATHTGPFAGNAISTTGQTVWYTTRYGSTAAELPWRLRADINPQFADHAVMAADIGMQVENLGYRVYSERELSTLTDVNGDTITANIESQYTTSNGTRVSKKPDVAVVSADSRHVHAIEVERDRNRHMGTYLEKLQAYRSNPAIVGVWYLCAYEGTANRVRAAANKVFTNGTFPLRVRVVGQTEDGWNGIPNLTDDERLMSDLRRVQ